MSDSGRHEKSKRPPRDSRPPREGNAGRKSAGGSGRGRPGGQSGGGAGDRAGQSRRAPGERSAAKSPWDEDLLAESLKQSPLPREVVQELEAFPSKVLALLGGAYLLLEEYPEEALRYAQGAKAIAPRSSAVREAVGMCAYQTGDFTLAMKELRSAVRISGDDSLWPVIADCERGLGRPEKALEIASKDLTLDRANRIEMRLVAAGARMDLGQPEEAILILRGPVLESTEADEASARLKYVYAEAMLAAERPSEAREWFARAAQADIEATTDAAQRLAELDAVVDGASPAADTSSNGSTVQDA